MAQKNMRSTVTETERIKEFRIQRGNRQNLNSFYPNYFPKIFLCPSAVNKYLCRSVVTCTAYVRVTCTTYVRVTCTAYVRVTCTTYVRY
jgi:hypothetical protein